ncbi:IS1 family transposase [Hymenobacter sp. BT186]|uniref:IS1 family transposase n=1 Tax=Hymenobacter telluris TaxID=2816474 RepID=A0A939F128_9BACT|nr:IS1 family transposase [Hymenobacter telluris]MBW3377213.1 recombinase zinc beta ribbon domain-containing protein [Hymenobacter norwichensis]
MLQTPFTCGKCGSTAVRKNGSRNGQPKYQCTTCRHQALFVPAAVGKAVQYAQVELLLLERVSQRAIVRLTGVSRPTIVKLAKKSADHTAVAAQTEPAPGTRTG